MQESESAAYQGGSVTGAVAPLDISSMPLLLTSGKTYSYGTPDRFGRPVKMEEVEVFAKEEYCSVVTAPASLVPEVPPLDVSSLDYRSLRKELKIRNSKQWGSKKQLQNRLKQRLRFKNKQTYD